MYLIYVNDMAKLKLTGKLRLFADDSALFYSGNSLEKNIEELTADITLIAEYFRINRLTLNIDKTKYINFTTAKKRTSNVDHIVIAGHRIEKVDCVKYLGLNLDSHLTWKNHMLYVSKKISGAIGALGKLHFLKASILRTIYYAIIHPHLSYASAVWALAKQTALKRVFVLQKRSIKKCHKVGNRFSTELLFTTLPQTTMPLKAIRDIQICKYVHKSIKKMAPLNITFNINTNRTRRANTLVPTPARNHHGTCCITHVGPTLYNGLPNEIKNSNSIKIFKTRLKQHLLSLAVIKNYL